MYHLSDQGGIIKFALWEYVAFIKYFARESVNQGDSKLSKINSTNSNVHNMTGSGLLDPFLLKCIHMHSYAYLVKKGDPYKSSKISWEPIPPCLWQTTKITKVKVKTKTQIWIIVLSKFRIRFKLKVQIINHIYILDLFPEKIWIRFCHILI